MIATTGALAQTASVSTVPSGLVTLTVPAGFGTSASICVLSFPLQATATASGQMAGVITGITSSTISNSNAGWTVSPSAQLSQAATPYLVQITSGTAAGRTFLLSTATANTATTVTLDPTDAAQTDLTTLGIVAGTDTYQLIPADTIKGLFGTPSTAPGIVGGTIPSGSDQIQLLTSAGWVGYYYNTSSSEWLRTSGLPIVGDNVVIRPDAGVIFQRFGTTALSIVMTGRVPSTARQVLVANNGPTVLANDWPVDQTLLGLGIQNLSGWVSGTSASGSDAVQILTASGWQQYYYNSSTGHWTITTSLPLTGDSLAIPSGTIVTIIKQGATAGSTILTQALPYSLN